MVIHFKLAWLKPGTPISKAFKTPAASNLFQEYAGRLSKFTTCKTSALGKNFSDREQGTKRWVCGRGPGSEMPSSEGLAKKIQTLELSGIRELQILIGGPDGFPTGDLKRLLADTQWSFGPLTLPHELAAIVAAEQIYRAQTILRHHPYHQGH